MRRLHPCLASLLLAGCYQSHGPGSYDKVKADITALESACAEYATQSGGRPPPDLEALVVPDEFGMTFLKKGRVPLDPWERPYGFELPKAGDAEPRIFTLGSDGAPGGEGLARDVDNFMIRNRDV